MPKLSSDPCVPFRFIYDCPHCQEMHKLSSLEAGELVSTGKIIVHCPVCKDWHVVRFDGNEVYISYIPRKYKEKKES